MTIRTAKIRAAWKSAMESPILGAFILGLVLGAEIMYFVASAHPEILAHMIQEVSTK